MGGEGWRDEQVWRAMTSSAHRSDFGEGMPPRRRSRNFQYIPSFTSWLSASTVAKSCLAFAVAGLAISIYCGHIGVAALLILIPAMVYNWLYFERGLGEVCGFVANAQSGRYLTTRGLLVILFFVVYAGFCGTKHSVAFDWPTQLPTEAGSILSQFKDVLCYGRMYADLSMCNSYTKDPVQFLCLLEIGNETRASPGKHSSNKEPRFFHPDFHGLRPSHKRLKCNSCGVCYTGDRNVSEGLFNSCLEYPKGFEKTYACTVTYNWVRLDLNLFKMVESGLLAVFQS